MFGIQWFDIQFQQTLAENGLTVEEAVRQRKSGELPAHIELQWQQYERDLAQYRKGESDNDTD
jgi:hypothetical protein